MRLPLLLLSVASAMFSMPAAAQDHSAHAGHAAPAVPQPAPAPLEAEGKAAQQQETSHAGMDHSHHAAMQSAQPDRPAGMDHSAHGAMDHSTMSHGNMQHGTMDHSAMASMGEVQQGPPPPRAFEGPRHAADALFDDGAMARARAYNHATHGGMLTGTLLAERLEARLSDGSDAYLWDISGWYGSATDKFVFKSEGEGEFGGSVESAEIQALWGHAITPFVDLQAGVRVDAEPESTAYLALGAAGLAPYMIHFDVAAFLSDQGDLTARIEAEHDLRFTQSLILQPRAEAEFAASGDPARGIGAGLTKVEIGARLRYEIVREFGPYIGVEYETLTGRTADLARQSGGDAGGMKILVGLRFWL